MYTLNSTLFGWVRLLGKLGLCSLRTCISSLHASLKMGNLNRPCSMHLFCKPSEQDGKTLNKVRISFVAAGL